MNNLDMTEVKVIDNVLSPKYDEFLFNAYKKIPWFLQKDIYARNIEDKVNIGNFVDENTVNTLQLSYTLYHFKTDKPTSNMYGPCSKAINEIAKKLNIYETKLQRIKFNLLFNNSKINSIDKYNVPHVDDREKKNFVIIYYCNDSDGDTIIFNEKLGDKFIKLSIKKRISPKRNRAVFFNGVFFHTSTNPIKYGHRCVMNVNIDPI